MCIVLDSKYMKIYTSKQRTIVITNEEERKMEVRIMNKVAVAGAIIANSGNLE